MKQCIKHNIGDIITVMSDKGICKDFEFVSYKDLVREVGNPNCEDLNIGSFEGPGFCGSFRRRGDYRLHSIKQGLYIFVHVIAKRRKGEPLDKDAPWYHEVIGQYKEVKQ